MWGDVRIVFYNSNMDQHEKVFALTIHTSFIQNYYVCLGKDEVDFANRVRRRSFHRFPPVMFTWPLLVPHSHTASVCWIARRTRITAGSTPTSKSSCTLATPPIKKHPAPGSAVFVPFSSFDSFVGV